jgi:hypothetical protein
MSTNVCLITSRRPAEQIAKDDDNCKNKQMPEQIKQPIIFYYVMPADHFSPQYLFRRKRTDTL